MLNGGTVAGGTISETNGAELIVSAGTLDGATVNGVLDVGNTYSAADLMITNGLELNGTALVGNPTNDWYGFIAFSGSQTLVGNGSVVFGNNVSMYNALWLTDGGTTLTIGPGITIHGRVGTPFTGYFTDSPQNVSVSTRASSRAMSNT